MRGVIGYVSTLVVTSIATFCCLPAMAAEWNRDKNIPCDQLTADWPLWSALSRQPWSAREIATHHYADDSDPIAVVGENAQGAFAGHGADWGLYYGDEALKIVSHMLIAPTKAVCGNPVGEKLRSYVDVLAHGYSPLSNTQATALADSYSRQAALPTEAGLEKSDPVLAAFEVVESGPFALQGPPDDIGESGWDKARIDETHLSFARKRWEADENPLWAVAILEGSRDPNDLVVFDAAIERLRHWPELSDYGRTRYDWRLVAQYVRYQLVAGRIDQAAAASRYLTAADLASLHARSVHPDISGAAAVIMNKSVRWFLERNDRGEARNWALLAAKKFGIAVPDSFKPLLVNSFDELYGHSALALTRSHGVAELGPGRAFLDTFSAETLFRLSHHPGVAAGDRRAMMGAAWTRAYALNRQKELMTWLPDLGDAFPELSGDIRMIQAARTETRRHRLLTHLMLKSPGLISMTFWARSPAGPEPTSIGTDDKRPSSVFAIDAEDHSDGNWWCDPDPDEIRVDSTSSLVEWGTDYPYMYGLRWPLPPPDDEGKRAERIKKIADAEKALSLYPIFKDADNNELALLSRTGSGVRRLTDEAVQWASTYHRVGGADDGILAETLALAVRATRYACLSAGDNGRWSRAAFGQLHRLFPKSKWAARTKYWYGSEPSQPVSKTSSWLAGAEFGIDIHFPATFAVCSENPNLMFIVAPPSCAVLEGETENATSLGRPAPTLLFDVFKNELHIDRGMGPNPPSNNVELVSAYCDPPYGKLPDSLFLFGKPLVGCERGEGGQVEIRAMALYYTVLQEPLWTEAAQRVGDDKTPRTIILFVLTTTPARLASDLGQLRQILSGAKQCLPASMQEGEDFRAKLEKRSPVDWVKKEGLPICPRY